MNSFKIKVEDISLEPCVLHPSKKFINNPLLKNNVYMGIRSYTIDETGAHKFQFYLLNKDEVIGITEFYLDYSTSMIKDIFINCNISINNFFSSLA